MYKNLIIIILSLLFSSEIVKAQELIYLDENNIQIPKDVFDVLSNNRFKTVLTYNTENQTIKKMVPYLKFGKLSSEKLAQVKSILNHDSITYFDNNRAALIIYRQKSKSVKPIDSSDKKQYKTNNKKIKSLIKFDKNSYVFTNENLIKKKYANRISKYADKSVKCKERLATELPLDFAMFNKNSGGEHYFYPKGFWQKDHTGIIEKEFFKYLRHYYAVLIKPNGEFVLLNRPINKDIFNTLVTSTTWHALKKDWDEALLNDEEVGIYRNIIINRYPEECS
ncbi:hypothetical protein SCB49_12009 [unidentified eubacterium SCB49]|nr:hypothetical protein SCB49_12009 [unidentified eubacterium SCB49]